MFSDLNCSFAHLTVHRLHGARTRLGLDGVVGFDHRAFPLELFNECVNERPGVELRGGRGRRAGTGGRLAAVGFPVIGADEPDIHRDILHRAARLARSERRIA